MGVHIPGGISWPVMAGFRPNRFLDEVTSLLRKMVHDFSWTQTCSTKTNYWMLPSTFATHDYIYTRFMIIQELNF